MTKPLLEACVASYASALAACRGGADRLELCANLIIGGTTPSYELFRQISRDVPVKANVLIRPRFGDFLYDAMEVEEMCSQITAFRELGANGVVIGVLTSEGRLDSQVMGKMMDCAGNMEVTLHRAFDMTRDPFEALEDAISLGITTVLTSGQQITAQAGAGLLKKLREQAAGRITIMAGSGVKSSNIQAIHNATGITVYHASGKVTLNSGMAYRKESVSMGLPSLSEYDIWQTDEAEIRRCADVVHSLGTGGKL